MSANVQKAVDDLRRSLAIRKDNSGGRLGHHDRLVEALLPIIERSVEVKEAEEEAVATFDAKGEPTFLTDIRVEALHATVEGMTTAIALAESQLSEVFR